MSRLDGSTLEEELTQMHARLSLIKCAFEHDQLRDDHDIRFGVELALNAVIDQVDRLSKTLPPAALNAELEGGA